MKRLWIIPVALLAVAANVTQPLTEQATLPVVDGKVNETEYSSWSHGINFGFGDRIGRRSKLYMRSTPDGTLYFGIRSINGFPDNFIDGAVMYLDTVAGGIKSTEELNDHDSNERSLVSGMGFKTGERAILKFAPDFEPDYALFIKYRNAGIFRLDTDKLYNVASADANATTGSLYYVQTDGSNLEMRLQMSDIGLAPGAPVKFVVTLLNGQDPYRSDEFIGVSAVAGGNPAKKTVTLNAGDFMTYVPIPAAVVNEGE